MSRLRTVVALAFLSALAPWLAGATGRPVLVTAATPQPGGETNPFYELPSPLPPGQPGALLRSEPMAAPPGVKAWRILYRSTGLDGEQVVVSGAVFAPEREPPPRGFPVLAVGHNTTGVAPACAPSLDPFEPLPGADAAFYQEQVEEFVDAGFAAVATDYRGLGAPADVHPYLVGEAAAYDVLDAARASRYVPGLLLRPETILWGHSQGGHAAAWAGQVVADYAPDLQVIGVVLAAPAAQPAALVAAATRDPSAETPLTGYVASLAYTWEIVFPGLASAPALRPAGRALAQIISRQCIWTVSSASADGPLGDYLDPEVFSTETWAGLLERNAAGGSPEKSPVLVVQGTDDPLVPSAATRAFVRKLCHNGTSVRLNLYPEVGHGAVIRTAMPDILDWAGDRPSRTPAGSTC